MRSVQHRTKLAVAVAVYSGSLLAKDWSNEMATGETLYHGEPRKGAGRSSIAQVIALCQEVCRHLLECEAVHYVRWNHVRRTYTY